MNLVTKQTQKHRKQTWLPQGKQEGGINQEFGIKIYKLFYVEQITKTYCIAQGTTFNYLVITYNGKESEK